jgi:hypothetical protein
MLPGFRFLFAAIVLSTSVLVFGLGAAALLHAAHEEVVGTPSWLAAPETRFAQQADADRPVLAMLSLEPPAAVSQPSDNTPAAPAEPTTAIATPPLPEAAEAMKLPDSPPPDPGKLESALAESNAPSEPAAARGGPPATADLPKDPAAEPSAPPASGAVVAASAQQPSSAAVVQAAEATVAVEPAGAPTPAEQASAPAPAVPASTPAKPGPAPTRIATLGSPAVNIEPQRPAKAEIARARTIERKHRQAHRAPPRHRIAQRAQSVAPAASQGPEDPFRPTPGVQTGGL